MPGDSHPHAGAEQRGCSSYSPPQPRTEHVKGIAKALWQIFTTRPARSAGTAIPEVDHFNYVKLPEIVFANLKRGNVGFHKTVPGSCGNLFLASRRGTGAARYREPSLRQRTGCRQTRALSNSNSATRRRRGETYRIASNFRQRNNFLQNLLKQTCSRCLCKPRFDWTGVGTKSCKPTTPRGSRKPANKPASHPVHECRYDHKRH